MQLSHTISNTKISGHGRLNLTDTQQHETMNVFGYMAARLLPASSDLDITFTPEGGDAIWR
jgi:hypothetical protein